jgi:hypothetical protein
MLRGAVDIARFAADFTAREERNTVHADEALEPGLAGVHIFDVPLFGVASASDPIFERYREPGVVGAFFLPPSAWLPGAKSVISYFLPFSETVRASNRTPGDPSAAWLHGRIEGQQFLDKLSLAIRDFLASAGFPSVVPAREKGFRVIFDEKAGLIASSWSERHIAYTAGLGTFGLSKNLITKSGSADASAAWSQRWICRQPKTYTGVYDYCNRAVPARDAAPWGLSGWKAARTSCSAAPAGGH